MRTCPPEIARRLLYIIHRGFVEARLLALGNRHQQLFDLADALENFSSYVDRWEDDHLELVRFSLRTYQDKYSGLLCYDYLAMLDRDPVPDRF